MIPDFDDDGYLPEGIFETDWEALSGALGFNAWRERLLAGLHEGLLSLKAAGCERAYIDGSFVTSKAIPGDYDVCYETKNMTSSKLDPALLSFANGRAEQKAKFFGEYFPAHLPATPAPRPVFLEFFQQVKYSNRKKGIIALDLTRFEAKGLK